MICRSLACLRMELCEARIASSEKLRKEWNKRLENNSMAVDRLQENRALWLRAGGPEPEDLATPTALHLEDVAKALGTLHAMLEKHGPAGGLDSFIEDIKARRTHLPPLHAALVVRTIFVASGRLFRGGHTTPENCELGIDKKRT